ncbi:3100_t:CDS:2, partial [Rhizophagus irregularis]
AQFQQLEREGLFMANLIAVLECSEQLSAPIILILLLQELSPFSLISSLPISPILLQSEIASEKQVHPESNTVSRILNIEVRA